jgi:NAD(P)-dependent dehydrogenase (short-subunit alcohol dehydrogenase family)
VASKHGIIGVSKSTALAYRHDGVRVNVVCPGFIRTPLQGELGWITRLHREGLAGTPEDVAEAVIWLCSDRASFITSQTLVVDGGFLLEPYPGRALSPL